MEEKLLIFKVIIGIEDMSKEQADKAIVSIQEYFDADKIPGYATKYFLIPDVTTKKLDIHLLYPTSNTLIDQKELLDLMIVSGKVPDSVIEKINKEINP